MREEIRNWWVQAKADLKSAENLLNSEDYYACSFFCQQAVEKGLKALHLLKKRKIPSTHSLVFLSKEIGIPSDFKTSILKLNPEYITTRYPDAANGAPVEIYNGEIAKEHLDGAKKVLEWLEKQIKE